MLPSLKVTCQNLVEKLILDFDYLVASCQNIIAPKGIWFQNSKTKNRTFNWRDCGNNRCCSRCSGGIWSRNVLLHEDTTDATTETTKRSGTVDGIGSSSYLRKNAR